MKNKYSHIKTFKDFENEKMRLHYQIRLSEKKLEIKKLEIREYLNPIKFFSTFFHELARPFFDIVKSIVMHFVDKQKNKNSQTDSDKENTKTEGK